MSLAITLLGHGTMLVEVDDFKIVVDPFFAPHNPAALVTVDSVEADYILVTHAHNDHTADLLALAKSAGALVIANFEICGWMQGHGYENIHGMNTGGGYNFPFGRLVMTHALHSSGFPDGSYGGNPCGFLIDTGSKVVYITGDTAVFSDMSLIGRHGIDIAILPIGDNFTMGPDDALLALGYLKPTIAIPCHYNTWPVIKVDVGAWASQVRATTSVEPLILPVGERREF